MLANRMMMGAAGVATGIGGIDAHTVLYLPMTGIDEATSFPDSGGGANCPHTVTAVADAQVDTAIADPFGGNSGVLLLDGTGDYLTSVDSADWSIPGDFTIDLFFYTSDYTQTTRLISLGTDAANTLFMRPNGECGIFYSGGSPVTDGTATPTNNQWHHIAFCRNNSTIYCYIDGVLVDSAVASDVTLNDPTRFCVGAFGGPSAIQFFSGYISNVRYSKGIDRTQDPNDPMYNGGTPGDSFTPPTGPYTT